MHIETTSFSAVASETFTSFFDSSQYRGYRVVVNNFGSGSGAELRFRFRNSSGDITSGYYGAANVTTYTGSTSGGFNANNASIITFNNYANVSTQNGFTVFDLWHSADLKSYSVHGQSLQYFASSAVVFSFGHRATQTELTGFSLIASAGTFTGDAIIYAYRS